ncbi:MAG TPA: helix-turn-helix transcriptional regulator [Nocardioidaceae bacterium]|nr:helix-turn-helix transcriptional regulator [Nocardioidaceae bacterium]
MTTKNRGIGPPGPDTPVYVISVAAELTGLHPQTLRTYDRLGLVSPDRAGGGGRRYTMRDIELLRQVARLTAEGLGLEGVRRVLDLENEVASLRDEVASLRTQLAAAQTALATTPNLPVRASTTQQIAVWRRRSR